jgi:methylphosphotriester-DNA--protein-cysteine methyltransferase
MVMSFPKKILEGIQAWQRRCQRCQQQVRDHPVRRAGLDRLAHVVAIGQHPHSHTRVARRGHIDAGVTHKQRPVGVPPNCARQLWMPAGSGFLVGQRVAADHAVEQTGIWCASSTVVV